MRLLSLLLTIFITSAAAAARHDTPVDSVAEPDTVTVAIADTIARLTEEDYLEVARELDVDVEAMKAVVDIEAGRSHQGFHSPGRPIINFDATVFRSLARRRGVNLSRYSRSHAEVFARPNARRHGSTQAAQHARLAAALTIDSTLAAEATFWGMFQIGGFNWKKCGAGSLDEFVSRMSTSEREQLELFAAFLKSTGLDRHLRNHNWAAFAKGYNGPSYARRRYHTRLAAAYSRHKKLSSK